VLGEQGRRIRELTSLIQKRFKFPENSVSLYAAKVQNRGLSAVAQCESLRYKLLNGLAVRRACYGVLRFIMESGAKGCEVVVSGKLRAARAKSMKFTVSSRCSNQSVGSYEVKLRRGEEGGVMFEGVLFMVQSCVVRVHSNLRVGLRADAFCSHLPTGWLYDSFRSASQGFY
jgi:hypothetical protein